MQHISHDTPQTPHEPSPRISPAQKLLACDVGLKRIGLAHIVQGVILPIPAIIRRNRDQAASELANLLESSGTEILVVGLPSGGVAEHVAMQRRIRHFISLVEKCMHAESSTHARSHTTSAISLTQIIYIDEDYTSMHAQDLLAHTRRKSRKIHAKDGVLDSLSACEILRRYLGQMA